MPRAHLLTIPASLTLALALSACGASADDDADLEEVATDAASLDLGTTSASLEELAMDPAQAARSFADPQAGTTQPGTKGCRTRTVDPNNPNVVYVRLQNCTGRLGRHTLNGTLVVTFSTPREGVLHAEKVSQDLTIDGRPVSRKVSADIEVEGTKKTIRRTTAQTKTNRKGEAVEQRAEHLVVVDTATRCRVVTGGGTARVGAEQRIVTTKLQIESCSTEGGDLLCPRGTLEKNDEAKGKVLRAVFDGSNVAAVEVTSNKGAEARTWDLTCTPR